MARPPVTRRRSEGRGRFTLPTKRMSEREEKVRAIWTRTDYPEPHEFRPLFTDEENVPLGFEGNGNHARLGPFYDRGLKDANKGVAPPKSHTVGNIQEIADLVQRPAATIATWLARGWVRGTRHLGPAKRAKGNRNTVSMDDCMRCSDDRWWRQHVGDEVVDDGATVEAAPTPEAPKAVAVAVAAALDKLTLEELTMYAQVGLNAETHFREKAAAVERERDDARAALVERTRELEALRKQVADLETNASIGALLRRGLTVGGGYKIAVTKD